MDYNTDVDLTSFIPILLVPHAPPTCTIHHRALCYLGLGTNFGGYYLEYGNDAQTPISLLQATIASLVVSSGCIAFSDVVADGIVVQRTRDSADPRVAGGLQSLCWGSVSIAHVVDGMFYL
jgi:BT1 family.